MKKAIHTREAARVAVSICLAMFLVASAWSQPDKPRSQKNMMESSEMQAYALAETKASANPAPAFKESTSQTIQSIQITAVKRMMFDARCNRSAENVSFADELARKNRLVQEFGIETGLDIYNGNIHVGMTSEMVYESLGEPCDVLVHDIMGRDQVEWDYSFFGICLCFNDGILSGIKQY